MIKASMTKLFLNAVLVSVLLLSCSKNGIIKKTCSPLAREFCEIKLSYDVDKDTNYIFSPDTTVALDVGKIIADGKVLDMVKDEPFNVSECPLKIQKDFNRNDCHMALYLKSSHAGKYYLWNDGRGILFNKDENGTMNPYTNSYLIPSDAKELIIKYRVLLPNLNEDYDSLYKTPAKNGRYTSFYTASISLRDFSVNIKKE